MKKIILGCAAALLSLGLLAGCNNKEVEEEPPIEEAVVITVDSDASVVVGESLALTYTVSPAKAEVVAASDNEDVVTAVAQSGTLYLEGVAEGSAIVTLVGTYEGYASANKNINVSVITKEEEDTEPGVPGTGGEGGEDETTVKLTIENTLSLTLPEQSDEAEPVKIEYSVEPTEDEGTIVDMVAADDESTIKLQNLYDGWYVTPVAEGETTITVTAEYTSDEGVEYTPASEEIKVTVSEYTEPEPEPVFESYTVEVTLQTSDEQTFPEPGDTYGVWIQSAYDGVSSDGDWGSAHQMTYEGDGVYTYTFGAPNYTAASYETHIIAGHDGEAKWLNFGTIYLSDKTSETGAIVDSFTVKSEIGDTWTDIFPVESDVDVNFYVVIVFPDASSQDSFGSYQGFTQATVNCWGDNNYCDATYATTANSHSAFYSEEATAHENAESEFSFSDYYNETNRYQWLGSTNIMADSVYVVEGWISSQTWTGWWNATVIGWQSLDGASIDEFVSSLDL